MTSDILTVTAHDGPGASTVLKATGEIDRDSRERLRLVAEQAIIDGHPRVVIDLAAVTFCDSSGRGSRRLAPVGRRACRPA
jgi:anti-sigma B factor antagonist